MLKLTVDQDRDHVVLAFDNPGQFLPMSQEQCWVTADAIKEVAGECEAWVKAGGTRIVLTDPTIGCGVQGKDGKVWLVFQRRALKESIPYEGAIRLADTMMECLQFVLGEESKRLARTGRRK